MLKRVFDIGEEIGPAIDVDKDTRITRIGARLRDSRVDEIPQLINFILACWS